MADNTDELVLPDLGPVRLVRRGTSSSLYRGRQLRFDREVAIKLVPGRLDDERRVRFDRECVAMGRLSAHPSIVTVFDSGVDRKGAFLVSEWLAGGSMAERLARGPALGWREAVDMGIKLAGALESAHRMGVVHDNLKPQNVLLSSFGDAVLGDFALAGPTDTRSSDTYDTGVHAAPERFEGGGPTRASDVYALASVLATLMLGHSPFASVVDEPLVRIAARKASEVPADLRVHDVPDSVCLVLERALGVIVADRPATSARLGRALQAAQEAAGGAVTTLVVFPETAEDHPAPVSIGPSVLTPARPPEPAGPEPTRSFPDQVRSVLGVAVDRYRNRATGARLGELRAGLGGPVRIVVAGPPGVGKSTLVNGIIGDQVAPTGPGAGPGVSVWYSPGPSYGASARTVAGDDRPVPMSRHGRGVELDLSGMGVTPIDHVEVAWPAAALAGLTLVDGAGAPASPADALLYLTPTLTDADLQELEQAQAALPPTMARLTTIIVLVSSSTDQWAAAQAEAERLGREARTRRHAQSVVAVGPFVPGAEAGGRSGLQDLRDLLTTVVVPRCSVIRAGAALDTLASALLEEPVPGGDRMASDLEQVRATAHELAELRRLSAIRGGSAGLRGAVVTEADDLLGGAGGAHAARLGLPVDADAGQVAAALALAVARWRCRAESPVSSRAEVVAARDVLRSGEGMALTLDGRR